MTLPPFAHALMRKSERALESARVELRHGDTDGAVNRAYYAMFNAARASLMSAGVAEGDLPRTHHGVIAAFGQHAVKTGRVEATLGRSFNEAEALRLKADYTGLEISRTAADDIVSRAEVFVRAIEREFGLEAPENELNVGRELSPTENADRDEEGTHLDSASTELATHRQSAQEVRRKAREAWLKDYHQKPPEAKEVGSRFGPSKQRDEDKDVGKSGPDVDTGLDHDPE